MKKSLRLRAERQARPLCVQDENGGHPCLTGDLISAGPGRRSAEAVEIPHDAFGHDEITASVPGGMHGEQ